MYNAQHSVADGQTVKRHHRTIRPIGRQYEDVACLSVCMAIADHTALQDSEMSGLYF